MFIVCEMWCFHDSGRCGIVFVSRVNLTRHRVQEHIWGHGQTWLISFIPANWHQLIYLSASTSQSCLVYIYIYPILKVCESFKCSRIYLFLLGKQLKSRHTHSWSGKEIWRNLHNFYKCFGGVWIQDFVQYAMCTVA